MFEKIEIAETEIEMQIALLCSDLVLEKSKQPFFCVTSIFYF
jgi:hypothetical protein